MTTATHPTLYQLASFEQVLRRRPSHTHKPFRHFWKSAYANRSRMG